MWQGDKRDGEIFWILVEKQKEKKTRKKLFKTCMFCFFSRQTQGQRMVSPAELIPRKRREFQEEKVRERSYRVHSAWMA